jgi:hypothetical protein
VFWQIRDRSVLLQRFWYFCELSLSRQHGLSARVTHRAVEVVDLRLALKDDIVLSQDSVSRITKAKI